METVSSTAQACKPAPKKVSKAKTPNLHALCEVDQPVDALRRALVEASQHATLKDPGRVFLNCCRLAPGVVVESAHPYPREARAVHQIDLASAGGAGMAVVFDPRTDTRAGGGRVTFYRADLAYLNPGDEPYEEDIYGEPYMGQGPDALRRRQEEGRSAAAGEAGKGGLPGVGTAAPLFIPADQAFVQFRAGEWPSAAAAAAVPRGAGGAAATAAPPPPGADWGWRFVAFACDSAEEARAVLSRAVAAALAAAAVDRPNAEGETPLHRAAFAGNAEAVEVLLEFGANPNENNPTLGGETPLHYAARGGHTAAARALLAGGADPRAADAAGTTPLHAAARAGSAALAALLLGHAGAGAALAQDGRGRRPAALARRPAHLAAVLRECELEALEYQKQARENMKRLRRKQRQQDKMFASQISLAQQQLAVNSQF